MTKFLNCGRVLQLQLLRARPAITSVGFVRQNRELHCALPLWKRVTFRLSDIGEGIREVNVVEWHVKEGDIVEQFDKLCDVESDKATVTITSRYDGRITKLHNMVNTKAFVGQPFIDFDVEADEMDDESSSSDSEEDTPVVNKSSHKRAVISPAVRHLIKEHSLDIMAISGSGRNGLILRDDVLKHLEEKQSADSAQAKHAAQKVSPAVRQLIKEHGLDITALNGTGKDGLIVRDDVLKHLEPTKTNDSALPTRLEHKFEALKGVRKAMFRSMSESLKVPHFAYCDEVDMTNLIGFRERLQEASQTRGLPKLTFMPFCIKAASHALAAYPILNSTVDAANEALSYNDEHNISIAIDTPQGLVVPNVKNCERKSIVEIAKELNELIERGRANQLTPNDFAGGTFSLSNIGILGGTYTHPVIMTPQVAIGAMGRTRPTPRYGADGTLVKAMLMNISWCADHRVIDGVTMAKFSNCWKHYLEHPESFALS